MTLELDWAIGGSSPPSPVLGMYVLPTSPTEGVVFKDAALILLDSCGDLLILWPSKTSLCQSDPLLRNPATYQSGVVCLFLCLSLLSVYRGQFQITPGKLPRFQTNSILYVYTCICILCSLIQTIITLVL